MAATLTVLEQLYGRVVDMTRRTDGSTLTVAAGIADTVLHVAQTGDFDGDNLGMVALGPNNDLYDYVAVDEDASTITLGSGLLAAMDVDDEVAIYDPEVGGITVEYVAQVLLDEQDPGDEPIEVTVQHGLVNMLAESIRGGAAEAVTLVRDGEDDLMIWQIDGKLAIDVALEAVKGGFDGTMAQLNTDLTDLNTVTLPQVQSDLSQAQTDIAGLQGEFPITSTKISDSAITTPKLATNAVTADKIVANAITADKIVGLTITGDKIAANTISADKIVANSIGANQLAANAVTAGKIAAGAIDGMTLSGVNIAAAGTVSASAADFTTLDIYDSITAVNNIGGGSLSASGSVTSGGTTSAASFSFNGPPPEFNAAPNTYITSGGVIGKGTGSARKYKENFRPVTLTVDDVLGSVDPVLFDYRDGRFGNGKDLMGVIADDLVGTPLENFVVFDPETGDVENADYGRAAFVGLITVGRAQRQRLLEHDQQFAELRDDLAAAINRIVTLENA